MTWKMLIVDDDMFIAAALKRLFSSRGVGKSYVHAQNGADGLALAKTGQFQFIVTDINMPIMDGVEMVKRLRQTDSTTPVIMMSGGVGNLQDEAARMLRDEVIQGFIGKPWVTDVLIELVRTYAPKDAP